MLVGRFEVLQINFPDPIEHLLFQEDYWQLMID
jgi:hypothetical protein